LNQQAANRTQGGSSKRTASELLRMVVGIALAVGIIAGASAYQFDFALGVPIAVAAGLVAVLAIVGAILTRRRESQRARMSAFLASELGSDWNPKTGLKASQFKDGTPRKITLSYPERMPDHDPEWRRRMTELVRQRMGVDEVATKWNQKRNVVVMTGVVKVVTALDQARRKVEERIHLILNPLFRSVELSVSVSTWARDEELQPERIELVYGVTALDGSEMWRKRVEAMTGLKLGGRWRAHFDPTKDVGWLEPRPVLPSNVRHPGLGLYDNADPKAPTLYYGVDENGTPRGWTIGKKSTMPHMLTIGPTGGGKTTVLRSLVVGAVAQGIPVFMADPKMIELTPFYGFPGCFIASTPGEIAKMIETMEALMYSRYEAIKRNPAAADSMTPVLFILDELLILRQVLKRHHAKITGRGTPPWFDSIAALLALARSALINVVIGVQRPDASLFDDGSRDNLRQRLSLMRLSPQGSQMLWGTPYVGVDLPMVQGRAMASPDGDNPIEIQTFWVADPITAQGDDKALLDELRARGEATFSSMELPVDVSPFLNDPPEIDKATLPQSAAEVELGASEDIRESEAASLLSVDTQNVKADAITEGDEIVLESGEPVTVVSVDEDPFDEDAVTIVVATPTGEEGVAMSRDDYVARVLSLVDVA